MSGHTSLPVSTRPEDHDKAFPSLSPRHPTIVGEFSLGAQREFLNNRSGLGYLHRPETPDRVEFDLNSGLRKVLRKGPGAEGGKEGLSNLLHCILANRQRCSAVQ